MGITPAGMVRCPGTGNHRLHGGKPDCFRLVERSLPAESPVLLPVWQGADHGKPRKMPGAYVTLAILVTWKAGTGLEEHREENHSGRILRLPDPKPGVHGKPSFR